MKICKSCRVITKTYHKKEFYYIRLNLVDKNITGKNSFSTKDIRTELLANRQNRSKAEAMIESIIQEYNCNSSADYFDAYIQGWLSGKKGTLEATTYEGYEYRVQVIVAYFSEHKILLPELKPTDVKAFYEYLTIVEHGEGKRHISGYSNRSMKDISMVLKSALNEAVVLKMIPENPAVHVKVPYRVEDKQPKSYISISEKDCFMDAIKGHRLETAFIMALYYGLRRSEICGLKWSAIHDDGRLYIEHTVTRMKTTVAKNRCKTDASYRSYPIPEQIQQMLKLTKYRQNIFQLTMGDRYHNSGYIFTWDDGRPYSPDYLTKSFRKIIRSHENLDDSLTLHSLRVSCISNMVHDGIDIKDIQTWVGHKDVQTTLNVYARTNEKQQRDVAEKMADRLFA